MNPRPTPEDARILVARLDGTAHRLLREHADASTCLRELHAITTDPALLGHASGSALGGWQHSPVAYHDGDRVSRMLDAAGADPQVRGQVAAETKARLDVDTRRPGIGMPS